MTRVLIISIIAALSGAAGQVVMRRGMLQVGPLESYAPLEIVSFLWRSLCNPWVIAGTVLSGILYFCLLTALSWTDVTVAFPLTAIEYVFAAVLALFFLRESVPTLRWVGIFLVVIGVLLISMSDTSSKPATSADREVLGGGADQPILTSTR